MTGKHQRKLHFRRSELFFYHLEPTQTLTLPAGASCSPHSFYLSLFRSDCSSLQPRSSSMAKSSQTDLRSLTRHNPEREYHFVLATTLDFTEVSALVEHCMLARRRALLSTYDSRLCPRKVNHLTLFRFLATDTFPLTPQTLTLLWIPISTALKSI